MILVTVLWCYERCYGSVTDLGRSYGVAYMVLSNTGHRSGPNALLAWDISNEPGGVVTARYVGRLASRAAPLPLLLTYIYPAGVGRELRRRAPNRCYNRERRREALLSPHSIFKKAYCLTVRLVV